MSTRNFIILMICCLFWGGNFVMTAWALNGTDIPPFFLAAVRALIVLVIMGVFLFKARPAFFGRLLIVCLCVGPIHLGFLYTGLQTASASASSIVSQMLIPFATILSVLFLKETIGWVRSIAIAVALIGVVVMVYEPAALRPDIGLLYMIGAYLSLAVGTVLMRRVGRIDWRIYVAWMALTVLCISAALSAVFETGQMEALRVNPARVLLAAGYAAIAVSIFAHGQYFRLLSQYDVSQVVPLTLMTTVFATLLGVLLLGDQLFPRYILGAALILPCVYIIARRGTPAPVEMD